MSPRRGRPRGGKNDPKRVPLPFKVSEVSRGIRGVLNMGLRVARVDIDPRSGLISIATAPQTVDDRVVEKA